MDKTRVNRLHYIVLSFMALTFLLPLVWLVIASFDPNASDALKIPASVTLGNYISVITNTDNLRAYGIGFIISFAESFLVVVLAALAAYPLSRNRLSYKKVFMNVILFMTALPMIAVIVPVYKMYLNLGMLDSLWGVILYLAASSLPYGIWLMKNFMDAVPAELAVGCGQLALAGNAVEQGDDQCFRPDERAHRFNGGGKPGAFNGEDRQRGRQRLLRCHKAEGTGSAVAGEALCRITGCTLCIRSKKYTLRAKGLRHALAEHDAQRACADDCDDRLFFHNTFPPGAFGAL